MFSIFFTGRGNAKPPGKTAWGERCENRSKKSTYSSGKTKTELKNFRKEGWLPKNIKENWSGQVNHTLDEVGKDDNKKGTSIHDLLMGYIYPPTWMNWKTLAKIYETNFLRHWTSGNRNNDPWDLGNKLANLIIDKTGRA